MRYPHLLLIIACMIWGGNFIAAKMVLPYLDPFLINAIRWPCAALLITALYGKRMKADWQIIKSNLSLYILIALCGQVANQLLLTIGLQHSTVINALIWMAVSPAFISIFNYLFFRQPITLLQLTAVLTGIFAIMFLMSHGNLNGISFKKGDEYFILASISWSLYCCFVGRRDSGISDQSFVGISAIIASIFLIPIAITAGIASDGPLLITINTTSIIGMFYQIIFPSWIAYFLWTKGITKIGSATGGMYTNLITLFGIGLSMFLLQEKLELYHIISGLLVIISIAIRAREKTVNQPITRGK